MSVMRIPDLGDRRIATKVLSDLARVTGPEGVGDAENKVLNAYRMIKNSGEQVTELRLKEVVNAISTGQVEPTANPAPFESSDPKTALGRPDYRFSTGNFIQRNADKLAQGTGFADVGQPYGNIPDVNKEAGFTESAADALGTFVWNFADSLLIGLPGLALDKVIEPILGRDSAATNFIEGVRAADTDAGIWGERLGVASSFILPGGMLGGVGKAGLAVEKGNLVGRIFGLGGGAVRRAVGFTGKANKLQEAAKGLKTINAQEDIVKLGKKVNDLAKERKELKIALKTLNKEKAAGKIAVTKDAVNEAKLAIGANRLEQGSLVTQIKNLEKIGANTEKVGEALSSGVKKGAEAYWNTKKGMTAKQVTEAGLEGMKDSLKAHIASTTHKALTDVVGDGASADLVLKKAFKVLDQGLDDVAGGAKNLGHRFYDGAPLMRGLSETAGKIIQNGVEEAIGFASHTFLTETIKGLSKAEDYDLDTLNEIAKSALGNSGHAAVTAAVFATGGGIPWHSSNGWVAAVPMKLFAPSRKSDFKTFFKSFTGMSGPSLEVFHRSIQRHIKSSKELEGIIKEAQRGIIKGKGGFLKRLRERKIIDFDKLASESPDALASILQRLSDVEKGMLGDIGALNRVGGITAKGGTYGDIARRLRSALQSNNTKFKERTMKEAVELLKDQAEKSVNMHWREQLGAFKHDSFFNALTAASIFWGGGGKQMIEGLKRGETHMADIFTHGLFSITSATHSLHILPGKSVGDPSLDSKLTASDRILAEAQNRGILRALGMDYGQIPFFKNMKLGEDKNMWGGDTPEMESTTRDIIREANIEEIETMGVKPDNQGNIDPAKEAFLTDIRTVYRHLRDRGVKFSEDNPLSVLNDLINKDKFLSDEELMRDSSGATKALAWFASKVRRDFVRYGIIDNEKQYSVPLEDSMMLDYANISTTRKVRRLRDIAGRAFNEFQSTLERTGRKVGSVELGDLKGIEVEGIDNGVARMMMNGLLDVAHTTNASIRDYNFPVVVPREKRKEVIELLKRYNDEVTAGFNGVGLDSPSLTLGLDVLIRSGYATSGKAIMVDDHKVPVVSSTGEEIGVAGREHIHMLAQRNNFLSFQGDGIPVVRSIDKAELEAAGVNPSRTKELENFLDVLRSSFGFKAKRGGNLTKNDANNFWSLRTQLEGFTKPLSLSELTQGIGIDFRNSFATSDMEYHIMRAVTSKISPEKYATFNLLKRFGLIYDDPVHGRVVLKLAKAIDSGRRADESILNLIEAMGTDNSVRVKTKDKEGNPVEQSAFEDYLNNELQPVIKELIDLGVINGYAPEGTFATFGGPSDPKEMVKKLLKIAEGRRILTEEDARNQVGEMFRFFNDLDGTHSVKGIDYSKVKLLKNKIVNLLGKKNANAYDWYQVARIMKRYGVFTKERNEADLREAIDEAQEYLHDQDFVDSSIAAYHSGDRQARLDDYDWIIGNEKHHTFTLSKLLGSDGLNIDSSSRNAAVMDLRSAAKEGRESFDEALAALYEASDSGFRKLKNTEFNALFTSLAGSSTVKRYTLGDHRKAVGVNPEGEIFDKESNLTVEDIALPDGYLTQMSENLGIDVGLLSGMIQLSDTNYSLFSEHSGEVEKAKLNIMDKFKEGIGDQLVYAPTTIKGREFKWSLQNSGTRKAVLSLGDLGNLLVFELPNTAESAKALGENMDKISSLYGAEYKGAFRDGLKSLNTVRNALLEGDFEGAFKSELDTNSALRFIMLHEMLGTSGMEKTTSQIGSDEIGKVVSRFRQMHSRQFTPMNRQAWESAQGRRGAVGYKDGRLKGIVISDTDLRNALGPLPEGGVTRGDGQVWFHSSVLKAQARAHGFGDKTVGVLKNMIIDKEIGENGENLGTFLTKNAGAVTPEMDALMERLGVSFIAAESAVKLPGTRETGKIFDSGGRVLSLTDLANGAKASRMEGDFDIAVESLRFNKMPHESAATVGYQIENMIRNDIVKDIASAYYNAKFEGAGSVLALSKEVFTNSAQGRAKLRELTIHQMDSSRYSDKIDMNDEFTGASISMAYLESSPYGSPMDFWFAPRAMSIFKKGVMQNAIFKTKEKSGRQDILASDNKGILNTHEGVMAHGAREITLIDTFDGKGDFGINFAFKLESPDMQEAYDTASSLNQAFFGFKGRNHFNKIRTGTKDPAMRAVEKKLTESSYVNARLFRVNSLEERQRVNGRESFIVAALRSGLASGKKGGVFQYLQDMDPNSAEFTRIAHALNNYVVDAIQGGPQFINTRNMNVLPPKMLDGLAVSATRAAKRSSQLGTDVPDGHHKLGRVMDVVGVVLGDYNYHARKAGSEVGRQAVTWGVTGINQRYPSARPNDTIPIVFLGHLAKKMGNQVMINYYDSTLKGEADYDIDNYNYWFRTPKSHLGEITRLRSVAGVTDTDAPRQKLDSAATRSLNPFSESDMLEYAKSQERASFLRGYTIKANSLVEKMLKDKMSVSFSIGGDSYVLRSKYKDLTTALDSEDGIKSFMKSSKMVQEIIDSKKGLLAEKYMSSDFDPFFEMLREFYDVKKVVDGRETDDEVIWDSDFTEIARGLISPYSRLLSFSKRSWVGDSSQSMKWGQMRDIVVGWDKIMNPRKGEPSMEQNLADVITQHLGGDRVKIKKVSLEHTKGMAEDAATKVLKLDNVVSTGETTEIYGKKANNLSELARYISNTDKWSSDPSPEQVLAFVSQVNTKNWNVRQAINRRGMLAKQIRYSSNLAVKGDKYHARRVQVLRQQYKDTTKVLDAINQGKIKDPQIMHRFADNKEREEAFRNTISVEAIKLMLTNMNVDPGILKAMKRDAKQIRRIRGKLWAQELNKMAEGHSKVYDEARDIKLRNEIQVYLDTWWKNAESFGEATYDRNAALLQLIMPEVDYGFTADGNKRYFGYKNIPADMFNIAVDMVFRSRPEAMNGFLGEMARHYAIANQYMRGSNAELSEIIRMQELRTERDKLIGVATRVVRGGEEVVTRANVLRSLGYTKEDIKDKEVLGSFFGLDYEAMVKLGKKSPEDFLNENIAVVKRRSTSTTTVKDILGMEHEMSPLVRVELRTEAFTADRDGVILKEATKTYEAEKRRKAKEDGGKPFEFDPKDQKTHEEIMRQVDLRLQKMQRIMNLGDADYNPSEVSAGSGPNETLSNLVQSRSGRQANHEAEGICG